MFRIIKSFRKIDILLMFFVVALIVGQVYLDLKMPDYTAKLTSSVSTGVADMEIVWHNGGYMMLCALGSLACSVLCGLLITRIASSFSMTTRRRIFGKVLTFSSPEMNSFSTPSLITRTVNDVDHLHRFIAMGLQLMIKAPILAFWSISKISATSFEWTLATAVCVTLIVIFVVLIVSLCIPKFKKVQTLTDNINNAMRENLSGVRVVRAFNAEKYQEKKFDKANTALTKNQLFTSKAMGLLSPVLTVLMNGLTLAIYWIGAIFINNIKIPDGASIEQAQSIFMERGVVIGQTVAFTQYALQVVMAFMMLIIIFVFLPRVIVSSKRISEVLRTKSSITGGKTEVPENLCENIIEFKDVSFKFPDGAENAISNVSFGISKGESVAIIGATGSGKSTIIDLLDRNFEINSGEILLGGKNIKEYTLSSLQDKLSIASQKPVLFKGTIKENIAYGQASIDEERVKNVIDWSQADFVNDMESGIDSEVMQGGTNFSGGQKQRLSIARALYKDAPIIVFDDTFSALDYKTDLKVRQNLKKLQNKTIIIVAQRIGTIKNCDKIIVLDKGKIVGIGSHDYLLKNCPIYEEIALSQLSKEEL